MSDKSTIYEITKLMGSKDTIQNDLNEALSIVKDVFYKKYIQKFRDALNEHRQIAKEQSSKEVDLLMALKPFLGENSKNSIDTIIEVMHTINTAQSIDSEVKKYSEVNVEASNDNIINAASTSTIVHEDGIYEIDDNCVEKFTCPDNSLNITELIFMLMLIGIIK